MSDKDPTVVAKAPLSEATDGALMAAIAEGNRAAFMELFQRYAPKVKSYYIGLKVAPAQAEDLVQEVMVTIWRKASSYDGAKAAVSTWMFTVARNRFIDDVRREKYVEVTTDVIPEAPSDDPRPDEHLTRAQEAADIQKAMQKLSDDQREVITLAFMKELSHSEIAEQLALPLGTVKSRIRLAMGRLREHLETTRC